MTEQRREEEAQQAQQAQQAEPNQDQQVETDDFERTPTSDATDPRPAGEKAETKEKK